jgi:hypothetical protein
MGEAKRRKAAAAALTVYHHTSSLRTNLIWMAGVIEREGQGKEPVHPEMEFMQFARGAYLRRPMKDFPPVAWFTTQIAIPNCLRHWTQTFRNQDGSVNEEAHAQWETLKPTDPKVMQDIYDAITLHRVALGFPVASIPVTPWPKYYGYRTPEGHALNESARDVGDNPNDWWISEQPVDVLQASEVWLSRTKYNPKLTCEDWYLKDIRRMVTLCREMPTCFIPPSWMSIEQQKAFARYMDVPIALGDD